MSKGEDILLFDTIIGIMLFAYGASTGSTTLLAFQNINVPKLAPAVGGVFQNCQNTDLGCISSNIAVATAYVGWAIVNLPILLIFLLQLFIGFANVVLITVFSPQFTANGVPFLGLFLVGLQLYPLWEAIRTVRGSSTGV